MMAYMLQSSCKFFDISFNYLKPGGLYIIEDVGLIICLINSLFKDYQLVVNLRSNRLNLFKDSNLIIIRNN